MMAAPDSRRRELAAIHIAKKQLALDDVTYRAMLWSLGRVHSSADLGIEGRRAVIDHLVSRGFKPLKKVQKSTITKGVKPVVPAARQAQIDKIEHLLAGRSWAYLEAARPGRMSMVRRICGVDALRFCTAEQLGKIIAALSYDARRHAPGAA